MKLPTSIHFRQWKPTLRADERSFGYIFLIGCLICEGLYGPLAKQLSGALTPLTLLLITESLTASFIMIALGLLPLFEAVTKLSKRSLLIAIAIGVLNSGIAPYLWFQGIRSTTAINASLISSANILFAVAFAYLILRETIGVMQALGCAIVMFGVVMIQISGMYSAMSVQFGDLLILLATLVFASGTVLFKRFLTHEHSEVILFVRCISGMTAMSTISFLINHDGLSEMLAFPIRMIPMLLAFASFARFMDLTFFYAALARLPSVTVSLVLNATPLLSILFSAAILGEKLAGIHVIAGVFIVIGMFVEHMKPLKRPTMFDRFLRYFGLTRDDELESELREHVANAMN